MKNRRINYVIALLCKGQGESIRCNTGVRDQRETRPNANACTQFPRTVRFGYDIKENLGYFSFIFFPRRSACNAYLLEKYSYQIWARYFYILPNVKFINVDYY